MERCRKIKEAPLTRGFFYSSFVNKLQISATAVLAIAIAPLIATTLAGAIYVTIHTAAAAAAPVSPVTRVLTFLLTTQLS